MANLKAWIEEAAGDEEILGIVVGEFDGWRTEPPPAQACPKNRLLSWAEATPFLQYEFDDGFGGSRCHPITAWTDSKVVVIGVYDGSTWATSVPRHPIDHQPYLIGGE